MASEKVLVTVKLQAPAGNAMGNPNLAATLGQKKINMREFTQKFNDETKSMPSGTNCNVIIKVFKGKNEIIIHGPSATDMIKKTLGIEKGSGKAGLSNLEKFLTKIQLEEIAKKQKQLNKDDREVSTIMRCLEGTAKTMGIVIK